MKKMLSCLFTLVMVLYFCAAPAAGESLRYEGPGFDTPEEALMCYIDGIRELDFQKIFSSFAWETQISHYSVEKYMKRVGAFSPGARPRILSDHPFVVSANLESLRAFQVDSIYRAIEVLMMGEHFHNGQLIGLKDDNAFAEFFSYFDNDRLNLLSSISNIRFYKPEEIILKGSYTSEVNRKNFQEQTAIYGGDEAVNIIALADLSNGETFYCCPTIVRYGSKWYVVSSTSYATMFLGIDTYTQAFVCAPLDELIP